MRPPPVSGNRTGTAPSSLEGHMLGQLPSVGAVPWAGAEPCAGAVVDELPLSVVVELLPESEDELELSLVCACATIAPPPTIAPARPTDSKPLRIHFCMCITSSRHASCPGSRNTPAAEKDLKSGKSSARICRSRPMLSARTGRGCEPRAMTSPFRRGVCASCVLLTLVVLVVSFANVGAAGAVTSIGAGLRGQSGLSATVFATGLKHVSALATDAQGRVWAATAAASDKGKDAVYLVGEAGATPPKIVTDVHTPLGLVWMADTLYVSQADSVVALAGFDGTSFVSRTSVVSFPEGTGEV